MTPDFDQIAQRLLEDLPDAFLTRGASASSAVPGVAEQLRQVWNARGAADLDAIDSPFMGLGPFREKVRDAIRQVDR